MDKQTQDRRWSELSEESKNEVRMTYEVHKPPCANLIEDTEAAKEVRLALENLFGSHNLNPKPRIKTWEDVAIHKPEIWDEVHKVITTISECSRIGNKLLNKLIATIQIQKLIDLGYGGCLSEEEWKDNNCRKYVIEYYPQDKRKFVDSDYCIGEYEFIVFHTPQQRQEFMSHESNRKLVEQYYLM